MTDHPNSPLLGAPSDLSEALNIIKNQAETISNLTQKQNELQREVSSLRASYVEAYSENFRNLSTIRDFCLPLVQRLEAIVNEGGRTIEITEITASLKPLLRALTNNQAPAESSK